MPTFDFVVETEISRSIRARQLESMFDVPASDKCRLRFKGELPLDAKPWNVGLIVGPSGCGKTSIMRQLWGEPAPLTWAGKSVIDDFSKDKSIGDVAAICQAVGFNTIPAWLRPYHVLSNGEKFRVELARRLMETPDPVVLDEFTSVVDRQVAKIGAHAAQKHVRRNGRKLIAVSCHYDIIDWLQPDWTYEPATAEFNWRTLQGRPKLSCEIRRVPYAAWYLFAPFHYMSATLAKFGQCFGLLVDGRITSFAGVLHRCHPRVHDIMGLSRLVTLPDWQGLGLAFILSETLGAAYKAIGKRFHNYPAHPSFVRNYGDKWRMVKRPGTYARAQGNRRTDLGGTGLTKPTRPCAVFEYVGPAMDKLTAEKLLAK